ncbi:MAG: energy-coupling factor transporter transmembrane protein EcfT [Clostridium sp.]|nr:energy-coupling factor transporter transmembrane protein EcfT [Clostridium sp.]MCM1547402.1 energy-coupling factor transporter transmembrane protein EcfT [Ruminococcus sp.]
MIKDITLGQYFPGNSVVHRMDARFKLVITMLFIITLFIGDNAISLEVGLIFNIMAFLCSEIPFRLIAKSLKPIIPILLFTTVLNLFMISGGMPIFELGFIMITDEAVEVSVFMVARILLLIAGTSLLTYTTSPVALTDAIERLLSPLKRFRLPISELAMMMTIALRFIPTLIEETDKIMSAQKARGSELDGGKLKDKIKAVVPIIIPLFVSAVRRAGELATAMECRCYRGGEGRTRMRILKSGIADYTALAITLFFLSGVVFINAID